MCMVNIFLEKDSERRVSSVNPRSLHFPPFVSLLLSSFEDLFNTGVAVDVGPAPRGLIVWVPHNRRVSRQLLEQPSRHFCALRLLRGHCAALLVLFVVPKQLRQHQRLPDWSLCRQFRLGLHWRRLDHRLQECRQSSLIDSIRIGFLCFTGADGAFAYRAVLFDAFWTFFTFLAIALITFRARFAFQLLDPTLKLFDLSLAILKLNLNRIALALVYSLLLGNPFFALIKRLLDVLAALVTDLRSRVLRLNDDLLAGFIGILPSDQLLQIDIGVDDLDGEEDGKD